MYMKEKGDENKRIKRVLDSHHRVFTLEEFLDYFSGVVVKDPETGVNVLRVGMNGINFSLIMEREK